MSSNGKAAATVPSASDDIAALLRGFQRRDRLACARLISLVENGDAAAARILSETAARTGKAHRVGVTGPPGAGKSTLVSALAAEARRRKERVGIVAVDPTSPFSGGAILGDRIRMDTLAGDDGVFIRSMATRGALGGLAPTTKLVADLLDAFGTEWVFVETVGVGQAEVEIVGAADTVVVVLVPESGDGIQVMKAGLMEIADVFVVNKCDRPGADLVVQEIQALLSGRPLREGGTWIPPIVQTSAPQGRGVQALAGAVASHRDHLRATGELERRRAERMRARLREMVEWRVLRHHWESRGRRERLAQLAAQVASGKRSLLDAASELAGA